MKITIATPLYNSEDYIEATMLSALNQSYIDLEYLIIDDCGTDKSLEIIRRLKSTHVRGKNIRIISHKKNMGVAEARNTAIRNAEGSYLFFLDSDDIMTHNCIELLYDAIKKKDAEIAIGSYEETSEKSDLVVKHIRPNIALKGENSLLQYIYTTLNVKDHYIWNILFKVSFIRKNQLSFVLTKIGEDVIFYHDMITFVKSCVLIPDITYIYVKRANSLSQFNSRDRIELDEIKAQLYFRQYKKEKFRELKDKPYAANAAVQIMKDCVYAAISIIKKKNIIVPQISNKEIKELLKCPFSLKEAIAFNNKRTMNIAFWILAHLPYEIELILLLGYIKIKK
jgi:glycosyltransferase involved in cell wall biosynthesis